MLAWPVKSLYDLNHVVATKMNNLQNGQINPKFKGGIMPELSV
jgi:hypothetical protein